MKGTSTILLVALVFCEGFLQYTNSFLLQPTSFSCRQSSNQNINSAALFAEMRILIYGTKNAYTTLRPNDIILYELAVKEGRQDRSIGVYTSDKEVLPLCNHATGSNEFYVDKLQSAYSAEELKSENRLLRIVTADRKGSDCYVVEEYLDSDIFIPLRDPLALPQNTASKLSTAPTEVVWDTESEPVQRIPTSNYDHMDIDDSDLDRCIEAVSAKLEVALLQSQLLNLKAQKASKQKQQQKAASENIKATSNSADKSKAKDVFVAVSSPLAPKAVGPYSQAVAANGFLFVSGCIGLSLESGMIAEGGVEAETRQALDNLKNIIEKSGSSLSKVCKTTLMIREMTYFPEVNKIYAEYFNLDGEGTVLPARSTFEVSFLPLGAFIEIDAVCMM